MVARILWVDDEPHLLAGIRRLLHRHFDIETAESGPQGLAKIRSSVEFDIIVSDMRMPVMDGIHFLARARELTPESVRLMLTGFADQQTAVDAVNQGAVFRFLSKPVNPDGLLSALRAAEEQRNLITARRDLLQETLAGAVKVLLEVLALTHPVAFGRAHRVRAVAKMIATRLNVSDGWEVEVAAMLSQLGCITVPEQVLRRVIDRREVSLEEAEMYENHPRIGAELVSRIPRLEGVAQAIAQQNDRFNALGTTAEAGGGKPPLAARILKVALDYDSLVGSGLGHGSAVLRMRGADGWYDPEVLAALEESAEPGSDEHGVMVALHELQPGMVLLDDIVASGGTLVIGKGQEITVPLRIRLMNFGRSVPADRKYRVVPPTVIT